MLSPSDRKLVDWNATEVNFIAIWEVIDIDATSITIFIGSIIRDIDLKIEYVACNKTVVSICISGLKVNYSYID